MNYAIKECYLTIQGEGANAGRVAVFLRFSGCNLWSGREEDRATAVCRFCDTQFMGTDGPGGRVYRSAGELADAAAGLFPAGEPPFVICTGGEPLLQLDDDLLFALQDRACQVAVETNGTVAFQGTRPDWVTVSPKAGTRLRITEGDELKLVYPQEGAEPERFEGLPFDHFFLQPLDGPHVAENTRAAVAYCLRHPLWKLSVQFHKVWGIP